MEFKIKRQIDKLGRVVIPIDLREQFGLEPGGNVYFTVCGSGILIVSGEVAYSDDENRKSKRSLKSVSLPYGNAENGVKL